MNRIYWQNLEELTCGWVESELAAQIINLQPNYEVNISKQTFDLRVHEGCSLVPPKTLLVVPTVTRKVLFNRFGIVIEQVRRMQALLQNPGVNFDDAMLNNMRSSREDVHKSLTKIIRNIANSIEEIK